jgi:hypothetical protein
MMMLNPFTQGFSDQLNELIKVGAKIPGGLFSKIPRKAKIGGGIAAGAGLFAAGEHRGVKKEEGVAVGATQQAYRMGIQRGALAMRDAIMKQMHGMSGAE